MIKLYRLYLSHCAIYVLLILALSSCNRQQKEYKSPPGFNLNKPYVIELPAELDEVSGIAYYAKDNSLFAESDEKGCLYKIFLNKPTDIRKWKFSHKRDYEDIVLHDSTIYLLNNNGDIVSLNFLNDSLVTHEYTFPKQGKDEFESLYFDDTLKKLVLLCKDCESDNKSTAGAYSFDLQQYLYAGLYTIDAKAIEEISGPVSRKFKPSAATLNPISGELYILSSINKLLIVADRNGKVKDVYHLNPSIFIQPEGIAFTPGGNLFISSEASETNPATILFYKFKNDSAK